MKNKLLVSACLMGFRCGITVVSTAGGDAVPLAAGGAAGDPLPGAGGRSAYAPTAGGDPRRYRRRCACRTGADRGKRRPRRHRTLSAGRGWRSAPPGKRAVRQRYSPTAALPAAASLSMTVPFADGAKRAPAWPPTYSAPTASRYFPMGKSRSCSPGWHRRSRMMIQCKRVYDPQESSDGYRVLVDRLWPRGLKRGAGL